MTTLAMFNAGGSPSLLAATPARSSESSMQERLAMFFSEQGPYIDTCRELLRSLRAAAIEHVFVGDVALKAYDAPYAEQRVEVCVQLADIDKFRGEFAGHVFTPLPGQATRYYWPATHVEIGLLASGEVAGDRFRQQEIRWPDASEAAWVQGVPVPMLARLIDLKLATWDPADRGDVAHLIAANGLDKSFAGSIHVLVRAAYLECCSREAQRDVRN